MTINPLLTAVIIIAVILIILFFASYVKAPADKVYIITGGGKKPKYLIGQSGFKIPFIQRCDILSLKMLSVDVKTSKSIPTLDYINIIVDSVAVVKIGDTDEFIAKASENFLNQNTQYINDMIVSVLEGNLREIIGSMTLTDIMNDRKTFAAKVQENAKTDMENMGLQIVTFNIQNIDDNELGVIDNLGIANTAEISKKAQISKANADKEVAVAQAEAQNESNKADVATQTAIAERENELALKKADLKAKADTENAKAEAAGKIEAQIQEKAINTETVNAQIAEAERNAELGQKNVAVQEQKLVAEVEKKADADKYKAQQEAEAARIARQNDSDASLYEEQKKAEAVKATADAALYSAQKEAEGIAAKGKAEAEAIEAKGLAEARAMEKKAEAYAKYNKAAVIEMVVKALPQMVESAAKPVSAIDSIKIYDSGSGDGKGGAGQVTGIAPTVIKQTLDTVSDATGVDLREIMKADTYDAKVNKNVTVTGMPDVNVEVKADVKSEDKSKKTTKNKSARKTAPTEDTSI